MAAAHAGSPPAPSVLARIKGLGFACHVAAGTAIAFGALSLSSPVWANLLGAALVLFSPALLAASVSGMEVPLASLVGVGLAGAALRGRFVALAALAAFLPLVRPELSVLAFVLPAAGLRGADRRRGLAAASVGTLLCWSVLALRNYGLTGLPLPATFYAKFGLFGGGLWDSEARGFAGLLPNVSPLLHPGALAVLALVALGAHVGRTEASERARPAASAVLAALVFFAASFAAAPPVDPFAFYHQRYPLPALALLLGAAPALLFPFLTRRGAAWAASLAAVLLVAWQASRIPARMRRLQNDARNIDDVQVSLGRSLANAPPRAVVWAVDAGAVRYFGAARVVDMMGLNSPELLGPRAQSFLDAERPTWLEDVPLWSSVRGSEAPASAKEFVPSTPYTVTSYPAMAGHRLVACAPGTTGTYVLRGRAYRFSCAR